jgi:hypothetical protein
MIQVRLLAGNEVVAGETPEGAHDEHGEKYVQHHAKIIGHVRLR